MLGRAVSRLHQKGRLPVLEVEAELASLGLTTDEARCYLALLARGRLSATELSAATSVTRGRIYDIVRGLLVKGAAVEAATRVRSFEAVPARVALTNLLDRRRGELASLETTAEQLTVVLDATAAPSAEQVLPSVVDVLRHRATVIERCQQLVASCEQEMLFFVRNTQQVSGDLVSEEAALDRGVAMRALFESSLLDTPYIETMQRFVSIGAQARHVPILPCRMTIVDQRITLLALQEPPMQAVDFTALAFTHQGIATVATIAFDRIWETAQAIPTTGGAAHSRS